MNITKHNKNGNNGNERARERERNYIFYSQMLFLHFSEKLGRRMKGKTAQMRMREREKRTQWMDCFVMSFNYVVSGTLDLFLINQFNLRGCRIKRHLQLD